MSKTIDREEAIRLICKVKLAGLSEDDRAEQLDIMMVEDWDSDPLWSTVSPEVQAEFEEQIEVQDACHARYDPLLMIWLRSELVGARSAYLLELVRAHYPEIGAVNGGPVELIACPCCGYRTLSSRGDYGICRVCWWEDDGQDNSDAHVVRGGPNYKLSLTRSRLNFLVEGISDPEREDLRALQEPSEKYVAGRRFELERSGQVVVEHDSGWRGTLAAEET